jgi:hypothetical protein
VVEVRDLVGAVTADFRAVRAVIDWAATHRREIGRIRRGSELRHFNVVRKQRSNLVLVEATYGARRSSLRWFSGIGWATSVQALDYEYDGIEYAGLPVNHAIF